MSVVVIKDWGYVNCVFNNMPNGFTPWGYSVLESDTEITVYNHLRGKIVRETEKAICLECKIMKARYGRAEMTGGSFQWKFWIPKSQLVDTTKFNCHNYFDGGKSELVDRYIYSRNKKITKTRFTTGY